MVNTWTATTGAFYKALGHKIFACRMTAGLSRTQLLKRLQDLGSERLAQNTIFNWENARARIRVEDLVLLCKVFGVQMEHLLGDATAALAAAVDNKTGDPAT